MRPVLPMVLLISLADCDVNFEKVVDLMTGREENVVVLADEPTLLGPAALALASKEQPMKVLGEWSSICLALRGSVPLQDSKVMDQLFAEAMGNSKLKIELTLSNGTRVGLRQPLQAWSMRGKIFEQDELSACAGIPCASRPPNGAQVSKVSISSDLPLNVQGVYWHSETDLPKPAPESKKVEVSSSPKAISSCTS